MTTKGRIVMCNKHDRHTQHYTHAILTTSTCCTENTQDFIENIRHQSFQFHSNFIHLDECTDNKLVGTNITQLPNCSVFLYILFACCCKLGMTTQSRCLDFQEWKVDWKLHKENISGSHPGGPGSIPGNKLYNTIQICTSLPFSGSHQPF